MMKVAFCFDYSHVNGLMVRVGNALAARSKVPLYLDREGSAYRFEAEGEQADIEALADEVARALPLSLFLENVRIETVDTIASECTKLHDESAGYAVPYCPWCHDAISRTGSPEHLNPFVECPVCGYSNSMLTPDAFMATAETRFSSAKELIQTAAERILNGEVVELPTFVGMQRFFIPGNRQIAEEYEMMLTNSDAAAEHFVITSNELQAMALVEKPSLRLKPKLVFRAQHSLEAPFYYTRFADDKVSLALCQRLHEEGVDVIGFIPSDDEMPLRCAAALKERLIVTSGRDLSEQRFDSTLDVEAWSSGYGYTAAGDRYALRVGPSVDGNAGVAYTPKGEPGEGIIYTPAHGALRSIAYEHALGNEALCGIHLSQTTPTHLCSFHPKVGYTTLCELPQKVGSPAELLDQIAAMDASGATLMKNYEEAFPKCLEHARQCRFDIYDGAASLTDIWAIAAVILGFYEGHDRKEAASTLEATALEFGGKSGPRIDYKLQDTPEGMLLDPRRVVRSAMSFKLAGVDDYLLSFGFIDSLADFLASQVEQADANVSIKGVCLSGDLFENRQLLTRTLRAIEKNYPVYTNKQLAIDRQNIVFGALQLGREER